LQSFGVQIVIDTQPPVTSQKPTVVSVICRASYLFLAGIEQGIEYLQTFITKAFLDGLWNRNKTLNSSSLARYLFVKLFYTIFKFFDGGVDTLRGSKLSLAGFYSFVSAV